MATKVIIPMADYGHDPTEVATPWHIFKKAGFEVSFATESGNRPACDKKMYQGKTQKLLGAKQDAVDQHSQLQEDAAYQKPLSWTAEDFSLSKFDVTFLPGGHEKGMRKYIESSSLHQQLANFVPLTRRSDTSDKCLGAICHGVQVLAATSKEENTKSVIHDLETTALPGAMEQGIFYATALFLGTYYKTYGAGSPTVEQIVRNSLDDPARQYKNSLSMSPFIHEDPKYRYVSGRFPPDAQRLAERIVELVEQTKRTP